METHQIAGWLGLKKSHFPKAVQRPWFSFIWPVFFEVKRRTKKWSTKKWVGGQPNDVGKGGKGRLALLACWGWCPPFVFFSREKGEVVVEYHWQEPDRRLYWCSFLKLHMNKHLIRNNRHPLIHAQWCTHTSTVHVDTMPSWHRGWPSMSNWSLHSIIMVRFCPA